MWRNQVTQLAEVLWISIDMCEIYLLYIAKLYLTKGLKDFIDFPQWLMHIDEIILQN